jgi:hypothetical protein
MAIKVEIVSREDAALYEILYAQSADVFAQQSTMWADAIARVGQDKPFFLLAWSTASSQPIAGLPLYKFVGPYGSIMTSAPQAGSLGGIFYKQEALAAVSVEEIYASLLDAGRELARREGCVALILTSNPLTRDLDVYQKAAPCAYSLRTFTQVVDLARLFNARGEITLPRGARRNVLKARAAGIQVEWAQTTSGSADCFEEWYALHQKRHRELEASPLPKDLLLGILDCLGGAGMAALAVARRSDQLLGGCIFIWNHSIADAFIMSSDSAFLDLGVNYAITHFVLTGLYQRGIGWINWQSSASRSSGVYTFKQRWGSEERVYSYLTWVFPGFEAFLDAPVTSIRSGYPWHYVAPFAALEAGMTSGEFEK